MADEDAQIRQAVRYYIGLASPGKTLTDQQKNEVNDKANGKIMKECCKASVAHVANSQTFPSVAAKAKKIEIDRYINHFLPELAITIVHNELTKKDRRAAKPDVKDSTVDRILKEIRSGIAAKHGMKTTGGPVNDVTKRLTDTSKYTGAHKERFDESGQGKGIQGRENVASNSGYVGAYKGEGTYDETKK